jgi:hypothetical protein
MNLPGRSMSPAHQETHTTQTRLSAKSVNMQVVLSKDMEAGMYGSQAAHLAEMRTSMHKP